MSLLTLIASCLALGLLRASGQKKIRVAQFLLALPTGALFLSTGGDDMPILALSLARRRRPATDVEQSSRG